MATLVSLIAGVALILLLARLFAGLASVVARIGGGLLVIDGLGNLVITGGHGLPEVGIGVALWLAGHWIHAARHRTWRNRPALHAWSLPVIHHLAPIRTSHQPRPPHPPRWAAPVGQYRSRP